MIAVNGEMGNISEVGETNPRFGAVDPGGLAPEYTTGDRRVVGRFLPFWEALRGDRAFPQREIFEHSAIEELRPYLFLIDVRLGLEKATFAFCGEVLNVECRRDVTGMSLSDGLPIALWETLPYAFQAVIKAKKPLISKRPARSASAIFYPYRCAIAPLGEAPDRVNYLLGVFSRGAEG